MTILRSQPLRIMLLLFCAGNLLAALIRVQEDPLGLFWFLLAFIVGWLLGKGRLLSYFSLAAGMAVHPALFLSLGIYKIDALHHNYSWKMAAIFCFYTFIFFVVMHAFVMGMKWCACRIKKRFST